MGEFDEVDEGSEKELGLVVDGIPRIGMEFESVDEAWKFWLNYGAKMGFCVRKHFKNCSKNGKITSRGFVCSNEGFYSKKSNYVEKRGGRAKCVRPETRTGCKVRMGVKLVKGSGKYMVYDFVGEHNHTLNGSVQSEGVPPQPEAAQVGETGTVAVTVPTPSYRLNKRKRDYLIRGEIGNLLKYFDDQTFENPSLFHTELSDGKEKISTVFWADAKMRIDYAQFGDVVTFDISCVKNKKLRPLAIFFGFNHFKDIVIFGAALLYNQSAENYKWLFETFLKTHNSKQPKTIFTDQDSALAEAVSETMPESVHGLSTWYLLQDATKHLSGYNKGTTDLVKIFRDCLYEHEDEKEFEDAFKQLKKKSKGDTWLEGTYKIKEKWAQCYMKNAYTLEMRSNQTVESFNRYLNREQLKADSDIVEFLKNFEKRVAKRRQKEIEAEFDLRRNLPRMKMKTRILLQASRVYTPKVFDIFQNEYEVYTAAYVKPPTEDQPINEHIIAITDLDKDESLHKCFRVLWDPAEQMISCSCKKFESCGILCGHGLKVLDVMNIQLLPEQYILRRWTRYARTSTGTGEIVSVENPNCESADRERMLCGKFIKIASKAADFEELFVMVDGVLDSIEKKIEDVIDNVTGPMAGTASISEGLEITPVPNLNIGSQEGRSIREKMMPVRHNIVSGSEIMPLPCFQEIEVPAPIPVPLPNPVAWMSHERIHEHHRDYPFHTGFRQVQVEKPSANMAQSPLSLRDGTNIHGFPNWLGH
ncbi:hypothetical protein LUZ63_011499 [Rhynchospora breviuscula]|uniref:Protein FAR1-RELATED SEQUENCE n=1 Tax=Rhynchospora breviuscula TaxID=2022672 RepID=A0A9Q0CIY4_9POAL|nr:hypothetical protein LUZ63_011499 [Rhynchospora breviuscula]